MLIDDDEICLAMGREILENKYTVYPIPSGEQALITLKKVIPDLILLDIEMPGMNGHAVLNSLKNNPETKNIPVIFITSHTDPGNELDGLTLGAIDYITKPFSPLLLLQRVENHVLMNKQNKELSLHNTDLLNTIEEQKKETEELRKTIRAVINEMQKSESRNKFDPSLVEILIATAKKFPVS